MHDAAHDESEALLPAEFTDRLGRVWRLALDYGLARELKKLEGLDFIAAHNGQAFAACLNDPEKMIDCLWLLCAEQIKQRAIDPRGFASGFDGTVLAAACEALAECITNFIQPDLRKVAAAALVRLRDGRELSVQMAQTKLEGPEVTQAIQAQLQRASQTADQKLAEFARGELGSSTRR